VGGRCGKGCALGGREEPDRAGPLRCSGYGGCDVELVFGGSLGRDGNRADGSVASHLGACRAARAVVCAAIVPRATASGLYRSSLAPLLTQGFAPRRISGSPLRSPCPAAPPPPLPG